MRRSNVTKHNAKLILLTESTCEIFSSYNGIANTNGANVSFMIKNITLTLISTSKKYLRIQLYFIDNFLSDRITIGIETINIIKKNPLTKNEDERLYLYKNLIGGIWSII